MNPLLSAMTRCWHTIQFGIGRDRTRDSKARRQRPCLELLEDRTVPSQGLRDFLYVVDMNDNTVKRFDATTGAYLGTFVTAGSGGLNVPVGIDFGPGHNLLVATRDRNPSTTVAEFDGRTGAPLGSLVPGSNPNAPLSARGIVRGPFHRLYVADIGDFGRSGLHPGQVATYDDSTGQFVGDFRAPGFSAQFNPRGVIIGPDGDLYVATRDATVTGGDIFKFDPVTGAFLGDFIPGTAANDLNGPGVPAFGPDGNLYVPSFAANSNDTDKILEFNGKTGAYIGKIDLDQVGQPRAFAQQVLFGPEGKLFAPIAGGPYQGEVRRYDVSTGAFDVFVPPQAAGGPLGNPWYFTFGLTNPFNLTYPLPPSLDAISDKTVDEGSTLTFTAHATDPDAGDTLTYTLDPGAPAGASIDPTTGVFTFTPLDGPASYTVTVRVTDNGTPPLSDAKSFVITVRDVPPTAAIAGPADGVRGQERDFTLTAQDVSAVGRAAGYTFRIDWGDGSTAQTLAATANNGSGVSVNHVFTSEGDYTVKVTATGANDGIPSAVVSQKVHVTSFGFQPDPIYPGKTMLVIGGTTGDDRIQIIEMPFPTPQIAFMINGQLNIVHEPSSRVVVYTQAGNDFVDASQTVVPVWIFAGDGNDSLYGGQGNDVLVGGSGNDYLSAGGGRNLLIGGRGADTIFDPWSEDIVIAGYTSYDHNEAALAAIMAEWTSSNDYATRIAHLRGDLAGGLNGSVFLKSKGPDATVFDDGVSDTLQVGPRQSWIFATLDGPSADKLFASWPGQIVDDIGAGK